MSALLAGVPRAALQILHGGRARFACCGPSPTHGLFFVKLAAHGENPPCTSDLVWYPWNNGIYLFGLAMAAGISDRLWSLEELVEQTS
jgi:hypothetical protein